jgi:hypothetical protein
VSEPSRPDPFDAAIAQILAAAQALRAGPGSADPGVISKALDVALDVWKTTKFEATKTEIAERALARLLPPGTPPASPVPPPCRPSQRSDYPGGQRPGSYPSG